MLVGPDFVLVERAEVVVAAAEPAVVEPIEPVRDSVVVEELLRVKGIP